MDPRREPDASDESLVEALFHEALELSPDDRAAFLDRAAAGKPSVLAEVRSLLAASDRHPAFLRRPEASQAGSAIGPYRVVRKIGEGGMGIVYEAMQQNPERSVALKVVRGAPFVSEVTARMIEREAISLARLDHPGIAAIYQSGQTSEGVPYVAMELVRGPTLREWAAERGPAADPDVALQLFLQVCDAAAYAHRNGVIHRDLKPDNILVVPASGDSSTSLDRVKVLDFGLARLMDADAPISQTTELGRIQGTLAYMSPEQLSGDPHAVDVRSDVYSLGVILYHLLTLTLPHNLEGLSVPEAIVRVTESEIDPPQLPGGGALPKDLDIIVHRALHKDPELRYGAVADLANDVDRYRKDLPILARSASRIYRLRKFAKRRRAAVSLGLLGVLLLTSLASVAVLRQEQQRQAAREIRMERVFSSMLNRRLNALNMTRQTVEKLEDRLLAAGSLDEELGLRHAIISLLNDIHDIRELLPHQDALVKSMRSHPDSETWEVGEAMARLGLWQIDSGYFDEGIEVLREAWPLLENAQDSSLKGEARRTLSAGAVIRSDGTTALVPGLRVENDPDADLAIRLLHGGELAFQLGDFERARESYQHSLELNQSLHGPKHVEVARCMQRLAGVYWRIGDYREAERIFREAIAMLDAIGEGRSNISLWVRNSLGVTLRDAGRLDEAETWLRRARRQVEETSRDPVTLAGIGNNLAKLYLQQGEQKKAERQFYDNLSAVAEDGTPVQDFIVSEATLGLAQILIDRKEYDRARNLSRVSLEFREIRPGINPWLIGQAQNILGASLVGLGQREEGERLLRAGYELIASLLGEDAPLSVDAKARWDRFTSHDL